MDLHPMTFSPKRSGRPRAGRSLTRRLLCTAASAVLVTAAALPAAALEGYTNGRLSVVSEPDAEPSPYVA